MKKLLMLAVLVATLGISAAAESPIKLSLYDNIAWPKTNHANIVLGLIDNNTPNVGGLSLAIGSSRVDNLTGVSLAWIYARSNKLTGVQWALYDVTNQATGVTLGLVNHNKGAFTGAQLGAVNIANNMKGVQFGWFNYSERFTGLQLGFVNYVNRIDKGLQIGLVNIIENNGWLPIMVLVNGKF